MEEKQHRNLTEKSRALLGILAFVIGAWFLSKMHTPNDETGEPVQPQDAPAQETPTAQTAAGRVLVVQSPGNPSNPKDSRKHKTPWWEQAAVVIAFGLLIVNYCQMRATKKSADTAYDALVVSERPWVSVGNITFDPQSYRVIMRPDGKYIAQASVSLKVENFGKSPAIKTVIDAPQLLLFNGPGKHFPIGWDSPCGGNQGESFNETNAQIAHIIFPGAGGGITVDEPSLSTEPTTVVNGVWIKVCITYRDTIGKDIHHTRLLYQSTWSAGAHPIPISGSKSTYVPISGFELIDAKAHESNQ